MPPAAALSAPHDLRAQWTQTIDARLAQLLPAPTDTAVGISMAMRDGALGPGKRLRPLLMLGTSLGLGADPHALLDAACALEMVHAASLALDDLPCMDDASERRGHPALHVRHGEDVAVLAAVGLLSGAFRCVADSQQLPATVRMQMVILLADSVGACGLVRGQFDDLRGGSADARALEALNALKTGVLFRAALSLPAVAAQCAPATVQALADCGNQIGLAFQLLDDLQDCVPATPGAPSEDSERFNFIDMLGPLRARRRFSQHMQRARKAVAQHLPQDRLIGPLLADIEAQARACVPQGTAQPVQGQGAVA